MSNKHGRKNPFTGYQDWSEEDRNAWIEKQNKKSHSWGDKALREINYLQNRRGE